MWDIQVWVVAAGARASRDRWHSPGLLRRRRHTLYLPCFINKPSSLVPLLQHNIPIYIMYMMVRTFSRTLNRLARTLRTRTCMRDGQHRNFVVVVVVVVMNVQCGYNVGKVRRLIHSVYDECMSYRTGVVELTALGKKTAGRGRTALELKKDIMRLKGLNV